MKTNRFSFLAGVSLAAVLTLSCGESGTNWWDDFTKNLGNSIKESLQFSNITGNNLLQSGALGFTSSQEGVPPGEVNVIESVDILGAALAGGSTSFIVTSEKQLKAIYLQIDGENGFYALDLTDPAVLNDPELGLTIDTQSGKYVYQFVLMFNQNLGEGEGEGEIKERTFIVSGLTKNDEQAISKEEKLTTINVLSGKLQISLSWNTDDDLDLYVFTPNGDRIFWNNNRVRGGKDSLDIDSNAGCVEDNMLGNNAENIAIGVDGNAIPSGEYKVAVHLYKKCSDTPRSGATFRATAAYNGSFIREFGGKGVKFGDTEEGSRGSGSPISYPTSDNNSVKRVGIITINEDGSYSVTDP